MADFNLHGIGILILFTVLTAIATMYYAANRRKDVPAARIFARLLVFVSSKRAASFEYRITFHWGCPSFNYASSMTLITFDLLDRQGTATEGRISDLIISDVYVTSAINVMKRSSRLTKDNMDRVRVFLTRKDGRDSRLFLYSITVDDVTGREKTVTYPVMQWVTSHRRTFDLDAAGNRDSQQQHVSLPHISLHEYLFFLIFAASIVTLTTCFLPVVDKTTYWHCILSTAVGIATGLLLLSVSIFSYRMLVVLKEAEYSFSPKDRSSSERNMSAKQVLKRFHKHKTRVFALMVIVSLIALIVATVTTFRLDDWSVNACTACALIANAVVILVCLIVTQNSLYTQMARRLSLMFFKKNSKSLKRTNSPPGMSIRVDSTIRDESVPDLEDTALQSHLTANKAVAKKRRAPLPPVPQIPLAPNLLPAKSLSSKAGSEKKMSNRQPESPAPAGKTSRSHDAHKSSDKQDKDQHPRRRSKDTSSDTKSRISNKKIQPADIPSAATPVTFPVSAVPSTAFPDL